MSMRLQRSFSSIRRMPSLSLKRAISVESGDKTNSMEETQQNDFNILLLGMLGVGKSALTVKYLTKRFISEYHPLLEGMYNKKDRIDNEDVNIQIYDTGCPLECPHKLWQHYQQYVMWADAIFIVFSVDSFESFKFASELLEVAECLPVRVIKLIGNKTDLNLHRQVSKEDIQELVSRHHITYSGTTSCCGYDQVASVFHDTITAIRNNNNNNNKMFSSSDFLAPNASPRISRHNTPTKSFHDDPFAFTSVKEEDEESTLSNSGSVGSPPGSTSPGSFSISEDMFWEGNKEKLTTPRRKMTTKPPLLRMTSTPVFTCNNNTSLTGSCNEFASLNFRHSKSSGILLKPSNSKKTRRNGTFSLFNNKFKIF